MATRPAADLGRDEPFGDLIEDIEEADPTIEIEAPLWDEHLEEKVTLGDNLSDDDAFDDIEDFSATSALREVGG